MSRPDRHPAPPRGWQSVLIGTGLLILTPSPLWAQTSQESLRASNPKAFDTETPNAYGSEFPFLPESDAMSELVGPLTAPADVMDDPDRLLRFQDPLRVLTPTPSPGALETQQAYRLAETPSERISVSDTDVDEAGLALSEIKSPFYQVSKTAREFGMLAESPTVTLPPFLPLPSTVFDKERSRRFHVGPLRVAFEALGSVAFTNNVFGTTTDPKNDISYALSPKFYVEAGTKGFFRLYYSPNFLRYQTYSQLDASNQLASLTIQYPFTKLKLGLDAIYQDSSGLFVQNPGEGQGQQRTYVARLTGSYPVGTKTSAVAALETRLQNNEPGGRKFENTATVTIDHQFGDWFSAGGIVKAGTIDAVVGDQSFQTFSLQVSYRPTYHFFVYGELGVMNRAISPPAAGMSHLVTPVFDLSCSYHHTANTALRLRVYRLVNDDTFGSVNFGIVNALEGSLNLRLYQKAEFKISAACGYAEQFSNEDPETSDFSFLQGELRFSYPIMKRIDLILFDNLQKRFNDSLGSNYVSNTIGLGIDFRF